MASDAIYKEDIVLHRTGANVVDDLGPSSAVNEAVRDNANVGKIPRQHPSDQVSCRVVLWVLANGQCRTDTDEEDLHVRDATMIDVAIGVSHVPGLGVLGKVARHVFMDQYLEIDLQTAVCPNDKIGTYSAVVGGVTHRIGDPSIGSIVDLRAVRSLSRCFHQVFGERASDGIGARDRNGQRGNEELVRLHDTPNVRVQGPGAALCARSPATKSWASLSFLHDASDSLKFFHNWIPFPFATDVWP